MARSDIPEDPPVKPLAKSPKDDTFPEECPEGCQRNCKRFFQVHTRLMSFAMYATQDPNLKPREICVYAFSCGMELLGERFTLKENELPADLIKRVAPRLITIFEECAMQEKEDDRVKDN